MTTKTPRNVAEALYLDDANMAQVEVYRKIATLAIEYDRAQRDNTDPAYWRNTGIITELHKRSPLVAEDEIPFMLAAIAGDHLAMPDHEVIASYLGENRAYTMVDLIADALDGRASEAAAELVRDTDPDDDLQNNYIGPMIDSIEIDYTKMAEESRP